MAFAGLLIVAFLVTGGVVYRLMDRELDDRLDEDLQRTFTLLASTYSESEQEDLLSAVQSHAVQASEHERLFSLAGPDGQRLAGNFTAPPALAHDGLVTVSAKRLQQPIDASYRLLSGPVGAYRLSLAFSTTEADELRTMLFSQLAWATVIAAALAVAGGALLAGRVQRRLDAIADTMGDVSQGELGRRIPLIGNNDDIDAVSRQVNAALDRLVELMEGLRQVGYDIAHDLKTPLNRLRITLDGIRSAAGDPPLVSALDEAVAELDQATRTFDALLRIAQIEAGARKGRFQPVELAAIVEHIRDIYQEVAVDAGKALRVAIAPALPIAGDRDLLLQLVANLVENALAHAAGGRSIEIACGGDPRSAWLKVRDDGPGIPIDERPKVFRRLYRMDKSRSTPGNGLGLSMVKAIADLHGATIALDDAQPGLSVLVSFPLDRDASVRA